MKKVHIWLSIISLIFTVSWVNAQEVAEENNTRETLKAEEVIDSLQKREKKPYTIRFGIDLSKPIIAKLNKDFFGLELVGDKRLFSEL